MWKIQPIHVATQHCIRKGMLDTGNPADATERMDIPFVCWLLFNENSGKMFLVDCGPDYDNETNAALHQPMSMRPEWHINERLAAMGVDAGRLDGIIITHLHWDHIKAVNSLPDSLPLLVQREELAWAASSRGTGHAKAYETNIQEIPYFFRCHSQYVLLDGEKEISPGLRVFPTPGHTRGSQSVLVETHKGILILANDVVNILENWMPGVRPGNVVDSEAYDGSWEALRKHERRGGTIVPGHALRIFNEMAHLFDEIFPVRTNIAYTSARRPSEQLSRESCHEE